MKIKRGFTLAEALVALGILGVIVTIVFVTVNTNGSKDKISDATYRKIYNDLYVASQYALINGKAENKTFTNDAEQLRTDITKYISTSGTYDGLNGYNNLKTLLADGAAENTVKGANLQSGNSIAFIAEDNAGTLENKLESTTYGRTIGADFVGVIVINTKSEELENNSIIPVYKKGLGSIPLLAAKARSLETLEKEEEPATDQDNEPEEETDLNCSQYDSENENGAKKTCTEENDSCTCICEVVETDKYKACAIQTDNTCTCQTYADYCNTIAKEYNDTNKIDTNNYAQYCIPDETTHVCKCGCSATSADWYCPGNQCNKCIAKEEDCTKNKIKTNSNFTGCTYNTTTKTCQCDCVLTGVILNGCKTDKTSYRCESTDNYSEPTTECDYKENCQPKFKLECNLKNLFSDIEATYGFAYDKTANQCRCCLKSGKCERKDTIFSTNHVTGQASGSCQVCTCDDGYVWSFGLDKCVKSTECGTDVFCYLDRIGETIVDGVTPFIIWITGDD